MSDFGKLLIRRLEKAADRNQGVLDNNKAAVHKLDIVLPILEKDTEGNQIALAAMREVYSLLETDGEIRQSTIAELKEAKDLLQKSATLLEQAGFDFANIQTISNDEIWLGEHLPTIKRALEVFSTKPAAEGETPLFDQALDSLEPERFEDIAHAVKRSGEKRQTTAEQDAAAAALAVVDAIKVAIEHPIEPAEGTAES